jgi:hypothetical protein
MRNTIIIMTTITITITIITITITNTATIMSMNMGIHRRLWQLKNLTGINMMIIITNIMTMTIITTVTTTRVKRKRDAHLLKCSGQKEGMMEMPSQICTSNLDLSLTVNTSVHYLNRRLILTNE